MGTRLNSVFYADTYHPIQAGSIDGTDVVPHDRAIHRAHLCSQLGLYDPFGDPKTTGDPYCTVFVGRLNPLTTEGTLHKFMSKYGRVKSLRLVRDIVTGASRRYAFVEFETEREMRRAYMDANQCIIDDSEILVDYNRQALMPGWIPRRLGGGLGGRKESGQLRFGGRDRPFRAPLKPIPFDELKKLGIPPPPEGRYMSRSQIPSPPRRERNHTEREGGHRRRDSKDMDRKEHAAKGSVEMEEGHYKRSSSHADDHSRGRSFLERREERGGRHCDRGSAGKEHLHRSSAETERQSHKRKERHESSHRRERYSRYSSH